jgi:hypothetical protein
MPMRYARLEHVAKLRPNNPATVETGMTPRDDSSKVCSNLPQIESDRTTADILLVSGIFEKMLQEDEWGIFRWILCWLKILSGVYR